MITHAELYKKAKLKKVKCPLCKRDLHNVREGFSKNMAKALIDLHKRAGSGWYVFPAARNDPSYRKLLEQNHTKLPCFGLVVKALVNPKGIKGKGPTNKKKWRLTALGLRFVQGLTSIPRYVYIPTGTMNTARGVPFSPKVTITQALNR